MPVSGGSNSRVKDLQKGDFLVFNDEYMDRYDFEYPIFKYESYLLNDLNTVDYLQVVEISNEYHNFLKSVDVKYVEKDKRTVLNQSNVRKVNVNSFELFRNYVINTSLISDNGYILDGESIFALKIFNILEKTNNLDEFKAEIKSNNTELLSNSFVKLDIDSLGYSKEYFEEDWNEMFNNIKESYIDALELLDGKNEEELLNLYISDPVYKFTEFTLDDCYFTKSSIDEAINTKLV